MGRIAYVNGLYQPLADAAVHVEDRGFQFADGIYEVVAIKGGKALNRARHLRRFERSLSELMMSPPMSMAALRSVMDRLIRRNRLSDALLYIQVTRGAAKRDHGFPAGVPQTLVMTVRPFDYAKMEERADAGVAIASMPDLRWGRCDIKTVSLLPNVLAKQAAREAGAFEAWLVDDQGHVTEGSSSNAWIVTRDGTLITRQLGPHLLGGVVRDTLITIARDLGVPLEERAFTLAEALEAREAFLSSAGTFVLPITRIDRHVVGNGHPGSLALDLRRRYLAAAISDK